MYPISPAPPRAPRSSAPPRSMARPRPSPSHNSAKPSELAATPRRRSAAAARFTSLSTSTRRPMRSPSSATRPGAAPAGYVDVVDGAAARVVRAGHADLHVPDAGHVDLGAQPLHQARHGLHRVSALEVDRLLQPGPYRAGDVAERGRERRRRGPFAQERVPHGHRDHVRRLGVGSVYLRVGPRPGADVPDDHDETGVGEPAYRLGDGRLGQAGELPDLGTGQLAAVEQVRQRGALVHGPQQARGAGKVGQRALPPTGKLSNS